MSEHCVHSPIPFNDLSRLYSRYSSELEQAAVATMRSGQWLSGPRVAEFAQSFADTIGVQYCLPVANGTDALELALRAAAYSVDGDRVEVVTVANAGGYTTAAARSVGLTPVYADIEEASQLLSIASALECLGERTLAVVATHLFGGVVDVRRLRAGMDAAGYAGVPVIEDCAQAHGARCGEAKAGSMGAMSAFSFYPTKNLGAMGDGGAVLTASIDHYELIKSLHQYGWSKKYHTVRAGGRNSRFDEIQAAILTVLLPRLPALNQEREHTLDRYRESAAATIRFVERAPGSVTHLAVLLTDFRAQLEDHLTRHGIATAVHYPVLDCDQPGWRHLDRRIAPGDLPMSRRSLPRLLSLPCFVGMTTKEIDVVCAALEEFSPE